MTAVWQKRLSGLGLFNMVRVRCFKDTVNIEVAERIYLWGLPRISWADRNFNVWWQTKDPERLIYGGTLYLNNIKGLNYSSYLTLIGGYNKFVEAGLNAPFSHHSRGWAWAAKAQYWSNHELWYNAINDTLRFFRIENAAVQQNIGAELLAKNRINYTTRMEYAVGYNYIQLDSSAAAVTGKYLFQNLQQSEWFAKLEFISDRRDQRDYPSKGHLFRAGFKGLVFNPGNRAEYAGNMFFRYSLFTPITANQKTVLALLGAGNYITAQMPYRNARQLGYQSDYVRGYEPYVGDGQGFVLGKMALRYALVDNQVFGLKGRKGIFANYLTAPISLWFNIFADAGRVVAPFNSDQNPLSNTWNRGFGMGLDVIAWYSAMARFEYSFNHLQKGVFNVSFKNAF